MSDGSLSAALPAFSITVTAAPNRPPTISGSPPSTVQATFAYSFTPAASDPDGQTLTFSITNKPSWATFSSTTGALTGTPFVANVGSYSNITISVSDGTLSAALPAFSITVTAAPNRLPIISGSPPTTVQATTAYAFTPTASDPDNDILLFSIANKPSWATFDATTGQLTGTPSAANVGSYSNITISVSDGRCSAPRCRAFSIAVTAAPNRPPTISGSPSTTVQATTAYTFTPAASDPDGQTLTFSITNKPSWAAFSSTTGALTGTPSATDVGSYSNITISVSDGALSAALPAFSYLGDGGAGHWYSCGFVGQAHPEYRRHRADRSRRLPYPPRHESHGAERSRGDSRRQHHDLYIHPAGERYALLRGLRLQQRQRGERAVESRQQDDSGKPQDSPDEPDRMPSIASAVPRSVEPSGWISRSIAPRSLLKPSSAHDLLDRGTRERPTTSIARRAAAL